jgi:signal recognition particle subunit SRP54
VIAEEGVQKFRESKCQVIIVDTAGRNKQDAALFEEMRGIASVIHPDEVIYVMDASIGQAAKAQSEAFAQSIRIGSIILTKLDGHAKGGGALTAVVSTGAMISMVGTGEHMGDLEDFSASGFIGRMLGMGDMHAFKRLIMEDQGMDELLRKAGDAKSGMTAKMMEGKMGELTIRDYQEQMQSMVSNSSMLNMVSMIASGGGMMGGGVRGGMGAQMEDQKKLMQETLVIIDSMTEAERDSSPNIFTGQVGASRIRRIARGSGKSEKRIAELLKNIQMMVSRFKKHGNKKSMQGLSAPRQPKSLVEKQRQDKQLSKLLSPDQLQLLGGAAGFQKMLDGLNDTLPPE